MKLDSEFNLLPLTIAVSLVVHLCFWLWVRDMPVEQGEKSTLTLTLSPGQSESPASNVFRDAGQIVTAQPEPDSASPGSGNNNGSTGADIRDSSRPWRESHTDVFAELGRNSDKRPNLDWIDSMFSSSRSGGYQASNSSDQDQATEQIKEMLKSSPSTQSEFWPYLVRHLANNKYHDDQYPFSKLQQRRIVVLELGFQTNGMLVRANVARSSGDDRLDEAAIRSAYAANPFSPPPASDRAFGYNYLVQIEYTPRNI